MKADIGVEFIGPSSKSITLMGDKIMSKRFAKQANVHIIPGFDGVIKDEKHCIEIANQIGSNLILFLILLFIFSCLFE